MKILISQGLSDRKAWSYVSPICDLDEISDIHIIREKEGFSHPKVKYHIPPIWALQNDILKSLYKLFMIIKLSILLQIDIYYGIHNYPDALFTGIVSKLRNKPHVISLISGDAELFYWGRLFSIFSYINLKSADYLIVTGLINKEDVESNSLYYLTKNSIDKNKIVPGYASVDLSDFHPLYLKPDYDIINVGRMDYIKRIDLLVKIIHRYKLNYGTEIRGCIVGGGSEKEKISQQVDDLNLTNSIDLIDSVDRNGVEQLLNRSKVFTLTSENEGIPAAICEAISVGLPVISFDVGLISQVIKTNFNGYLVRFGDIDTFVQKIHNLLNQEELYHKISNNAIQSSKQCSQSNRSDTWLKIINHLD